MDLANSLIVLHINLYNRTFLTLLGNRIGKMLKVDAITLEQSKGKCAIIYVKVDLNEALLFEYAIRGKTYYIEYESLHLICFKCGKYTHYVEGYPYRSKKERDHNEEMVDVDRGLEREVVNQGQVVYGN